MADKKISELNSASLPLSGLEEVPIVQDGETKKVSLENISGAVDSVNGQTGTVVLSADDIPTGATHQIPTILEVSLIYSNLAEIETNTDEIALLQTTKQDKLIGYRETGTPEDENLLVEIGDFDNVGSGFRVEVDTENEWLNVRSESTKSTRVNKESLTFIDGLNEAELLQPSKTGVYTENIATEQYVETSLGNFFDSSIVALNRRVIDNSATLDRKLRFVQEDLDAESTTPTLMWVNSAHKNNDLYSVLPTDGSGDFNIAIQSNKWVVGEDGLLTEVLAGNLPCTYINGYGQLLVEDENINKLSYSDNFSHFSWFKNASTVTFVNELNVFGTMGCYEYAPNTATNISNQFLRLNPNIGLNNENYNYYLFVKYSNKQYVKISYISFSQTYHYHVAVFDLINGVIASSNTGSAEVTGANQNIEDYGNGWFKISITANIPPSNVMNFEFNVVDSPNPAYVSYGRVTQNTLSSEKVLICCAQLEVGNKSSSYIPTNGSAVTRLADNITATPPAGVTEITETINGVDNVITTIPTTYSMPIGLIDKITMR